MKTYNVRTELAYDFILESFRRSEWSKCEQVRGIHYKSDCCSALHAIPPAEDSKYARVYYFTKLQHARTNILNAEVKLSTFEDVNDLFEIYPFIEVNEEDRENTDQRRNLASERAKEKAFLSTTLDWNSPVMWSHYADMHRGVCLGLDIRKDNLQPISYISNRGLVRKDALDNMNDDIFLIKNSSWEYENEYRYIFDIDDTLKLKPLSEGSEVTGYFLGISGDILSIKEVIFGINVAQEEIINFTNELKDHLSGVTVIQARKSSHEYKMVPESILERSFEPYFFRGDFGLESYKDTFRKSGIIIE